MANPPPPYDDITGISRTVMKDNAQESIVNYNGNARPGEIVADLTQDPPTLYIGNNLGQLTLLNSGGGSGNAQPAGPVGAIQYNSGGNLFGGTANVTVSGTGIGVTGNVTAGNVVTDSVYSNSTGNINFGANLIPAANTFTLGSATAPWADAFFGPESITILDNTGNILNSVIIQNIAANIVIGTTGLTINRFGTTDPIFRIEAITGQIFSDAETIISNANDSSNVTSGSLQTAGGAGIAKNLYVGGNLITAGTATVNGNPVVTQVATAFNPQFRDASNTFAGGTVTASYCLQNSLCFFQVRVDFAGVTNYGNSQYQITLPFPTAGNYTSRDGTLHQVGGGGGSGANTLYHIGAHLDIDVSNTVMKLNYFQTASDLPWKFNTPGGVPPGGTNAYWAVAGDAHFDINGQYLIA